MKIFKIAFLFGLIVLLSQKAFSQTNTVTMQTKIKTMKQELLLESLKEVEIVGIGVSVRGVIQVDELYRLQTEISRILIENLNFKIIVIEDSFEAGLKLNNFIQGNTTDELEEVMRNIWRPWQTEALKDFFTWLRAHNQTNQDNKVSLMGFDTETDSFDIDFARNILKTYDTENKKIIYLGGIAHTIRRSYHNDDKSISIGTVLSKELENKFFSIGLIVGDIPSIMPKPTGDFIEALLLERSDEIQWIDFGNHQTKKELTSIYKKQFKLRCVGPKYDASIDSDFYILADSVDKNFDMLIFTPHGTLASSIS